MEEGGLQEGRCQESCEKKMKPVTQPGDGAVCGFSSINEALCIFSICSLLGRAEHLDVCSIQRSAFSCQCAALLFQSLVVKSGHRQEPPPPSLFSSLFPSLPLSTCPLFFLLHLFLLQRQILSSPVFFFYHLPASPQ